jgi:hypothetical protein
VPNSDGATSFVSIVHYTPVEPFSPNLLIACRAASVAVKLAVAALTLPAMLFVNVCLKLLTTLFLKHNR